MKDTFIHLELHVDYFCIYRLHRCPTQKIYFTYFKNSEAFVNIPLLLIRPKGLPHVWWFQIRWSLKIISPFRTWLCVTQSQLRLLPACKTQGTQKHACKHTVATLRLFKSFLCVMRLHCISLSVMPVLCACIVMFHLPISVGSESPGQLGAGLRRTGGWGLARWSVLRAMCVWSGEPVVGVWVGHGIQWPGWNNKWSTCDWTFINYQWGSYTGVRSENFFGPTRWVSCSCFSR